MITEVYVPRGRLEEFLTLAGSALRQTRANVIYGTVRLIKRDETTFLAWARDDWACIVFNLHVDHSAAGLHDARVQFQTLIDVAQGLGGSFYLTYHRFATAMQLRVGHPRIDAMLAMKKQFDPAHVISSQWFLHLRRILGDEIPDTCFGEPQLPRQPGLSHNEKATNGK